MSKLWSRGSWGRYLALFLAVVLALNTVSPAVKAEGFDEPAEQTQETQPETELTQETEPEEKEEPAEPGEEDPAEEPAEETTEVEPAEEPVEEPAENPSEEEPVEESEEETAEAEPAEEPTEQEPAEEPTEAEPVEESAEEEPAEAPSEEDPVQQPVREGEELPVLEEKTDTYAKINTPGERVRFRFTSLNPSGYRFHYWCAESADITMMLRIYDESGALIEETTGGDSSDLFTKLMPESDYEVEVGFVEEEPELTWTIGIQAVPLYITLERPEENISFMKYSNTELNAVYDYTGQQIYFEWAKDGMILDGESYSYITAFEAGRYTCRVYDDFGNEAIYTANVDETPYWYVYAFTQTPADPAIGEQVTLYFSFSIDGDEEELSFTYQWYKFDDENGNWTAIEGASDSEYTAIMENGARYRCLVRDQYGNQRDAQFTLRVNNHLSVESEQETVYVAFGENAALRAIISANDMTGMTYAWSEFTSTGWNSIEGDSAELTVENITNYRRFRLDVTDRYQNSESAWFYVHVENHFLAEPVQKFFEVTPGESVTMEVSVSADDKTGITYVWTDGDGNRIETATGSSCTVEVEKNSVCVCRVTDKYGNYEDVQFYITITTIKILSTSQLYKLVQAGESVALTVEAASSSGTLHYEWMAYDSFSYEWVTLPFENGNATIDTSAYGEPRYNAQVCCRIWDDFESKEINFVIGVLDNLTKLTYNEEAMAKGDRTSYFSFVPEETGYYSFKSMASGSTMCTLYEAANENWDYLKYDDNSGEDYNFLVTEKLYKDHLYVFVVQFYNTMDDFPVILTQADHYLGLNMESYQYIELEENQTAILEVLFESDSTALSYEWYYANNSNDHMVTWEDVTGSVYETTRPGNYHCNVRDNYGNSISVEFDVRLAYMPLEASVDSAIGNSFYLELGESAQLNVLITESNNQQVYFTWYHNYELIEETGSSITVTRRGEYYCDVSDDYGNEVTVHFWVDCNASEETINIISSSPKYNLAGEGDTVTLTVEAASEYGDIHYSWRIEDNNNVDALISNEGGTASIELNSMEQNQSYLYVYCRMQDDYTDKEIEFSIEVFKYLTELTLNEEAVAKGDVYNYFTFTPEETFPYEFVSSSVGDPFCYLYEVLENDRTQIDFDDDSGENNNFTIKSVLVAGHQYLFEVRQWNSAEYKVVLAKAEHYLMLDMESPQEVYLEEGKTAILQPVLMTNSETLRYRWNYENNSGNHNVLLKDATGPAYETAKPGNYIVFIEDDYNNAVEAVFKVRLANMPLEAYYDEETGNNFYLEPGESALLKVDVTNSAGQEIHFRWYRNNEVMEGESDDSVTVTKGGEYSCDVYDDYGNEVTVNFYVRYNVYLYARYDQYYYSVYYGGMAELKVIVESDGQDLYFRWYHEDELVEENGTNIYRTNIGGSYTCWVSDDYGNESAVNFRVYAVSVDEWGISAYTKPNYNGLVSSGEDVTFEVSLYNVADPSAFTYAWYQLPGRADLDESEWIRYENENGTTLTLHNITEMIFVACKVTDPFGASSRTHVFTASVQNFLNVKAANDQTVFAVAEGESVTLEVLVYADDMEGLHYEWLEYHSEDNAWYPLDNTISSLTVTKVGTDVQSFNCIVSDRYGNEEEVFFDICSENNLTAEAVNPYRYVTPGTKETLEVTFAADDPEGITVTWFDEYGWEMTGVTGPTREVWVYYNTIYPCRVTDRYGMEVWVYFERVTDQTWYLESSMTPEDGHVDYGKEASLSNELNVIWYGTSDPGVEFSWFTTADKEDPDSWIKLEGEDGSDLNPVVEEHRFYKLEVKDKYGLSEERIFEVFVENHLELEYDSEPEMTSAGGSVTLEAEVSADDLDDAQYIWYTYDSNHRAGRIILSTDGPTLTVDNVLYFNTVYLDVIDKYGNTETAELCYGVENHFTAEAEETVVKVGLNENAELKVVYAADNTEDMTFEWFDRDGEKLLTTGPSLSVETVKESQEYYCCVTDRYGTMIRVDFTVKLDVGWDVEIQYQEVVPLDSNAVITLQLTGEYEISDLYFSWYHSYEGDYWYNYWNASGTKLEYQIYSTSPHYFRCEVTDGTGYMKTVEAAIRGDNAFEVSFVKGGTENIVPYGGDVTIEFALSGHNLSGCQYRWERYIDFGDDGEFQNIGISELSYTIRNVTKFVRYRFCAEDGYGGRFETEFTVDAASVPRIAVTADKESYDYGDTASISAVVQNVEENEENLSSSLTFTLADSSGTKLDGFLVQSTTGLSGEARFPLFDETMEEGTYKVIVEKVIGTQTIRGECSFYYTGYKENENDYSGYTIELTIDPEIVADGDTVFWWAYVKDAEGKPAEGVKVDFRLLDEDGNNLYLGGYDYIYNSTNEEGKCRLGVTFSEDVENEIERYIVQVEIDGTDISASKPFVYIGYEAYALDQTAATIPVNETLQLKLENPNGVVGPGTWTSSDPSVASVDENGLVTAHKYGKATIHVVLKNYEADCEVQTLFRDVTGSPDKGAPDYQYYYTPVYWAADNGITVGYSSGEYAGKFGVGLDCQRRELMIFLWRYAGEPTKDKNGKAYGDARTMFNDLKDYGPSTATNKAIAWAYKEGITKGYSDGGFHPKDSIVRKDVMILLYRLAGKPAVSGTLTFTDCKSLNKNSDTYKAILWGSKNGITNGYSSGQYAGQFGTGLSCLREQIVTFLYRYNKLP